MVSPFSEVDIDTATAVEPLLVKTYPGQLLNHSPVSVEEMA